MDKIYIDHNATTPLDPKVLEEMLPYLQDDWGNPSSVHWAARGPKAGLDRARERVAALLNAAPLEIVFNSTGTEGDNHAIKGAAFARKNKGNHIITTVVEHPAVLNTCKYLEKEGFTVTYLKVDPMGMLDLEELKAAIRPETILITIMYANNETGVIFPIPEIGDIAKERGIIFHTDAVQAVGKIPIDVKTLNVDLLTLSGHKLYGPKGTGALYVRRGVRLVPLLHGGHQERSRRGGTENVAGLVALGKACELAGENLAENMARKKALRDRLEKGIMANVPDAKINGDIEKRLPNTTNISFEYVEGESLLLHLDMRGVAASSGSACTSGSLEASHVLLAMSLSHEMSHGSVRFSLGRHNTEAEIDYIIEIMPPIVERMRSMSPLYAGAK